MPTKIQSTDVISGAQYLKLIEDYKAYDKEQKKLIHKLHKKINQLVQRDPELMRYMQRSDLVHQLEQEIHKLRKDNEELLIRVVKLQERVNELEADSVNFSPAVNII